MIHPYKLGGYNIIIDVSSGSIHSVDNVAFDAIRMYEDLSKSELSERLGAMYPGITGTDIRELLHDIDQLIIRGKLFSPDIFEPAEHRPAAIREPAVKALCLNVSHMCNMSCSYCFAGRGEYGGGGGLMSAETGRLAIDFLLAGSGTHKKLDVDFFGGEPLMNFDVVCDIIRYARKAERNTDKRFRFTLTTNGRLIDSDVIDFTNREMHNVVLSLDGRPEINDSYRRLPDGTGSYNDVLPKIKALVEARRGKGYYIRGTFTSKNLDFSNDILHLADLGFKELSMEPAVAKPGEPYELKPDDLPVIKRQYEILAIEMLRRKSEGRGFTFYHYNLDLTGGACVHKRIAGCGVGTEYLAVTPSGELYPCHQFVGDPRFLMGDVKNGVTNIRLRDELAGCNIYSRRECRECWARMYCSGGCAANAFNASGSVGGIYELGCEMFKKRIECAVMMQAAGLS